MNDNPLTSYPRLGAQTLSPDRRADMRTLLQAAVREARPVRSRRIRYALTGAGAAVLVAGGGAVAYSSLSSSAPVVDRASARCYSIASYHAGNNFPGTTVSSASAAGQSGQSQVANALDVCTDLWRQGFLQLGVASVTAHPDTAVAHPVPPLAACVLPDGRAAIFPGGPTTCAHLGLAAATR
jgi:hypothetical protein